MNPRKSIKLLPNPIHTASESVYLRKNTVYTYISIHIYVYTGRIFAEDIHNIRKTEREIEGKSYSKDEDARSRGGQCTFGRLIPTSQGPHDLAALAVHRVTSALHPRTDRVLAVTEKQSLISYERKYIYIYI